MKKYAIILLFISLLSCGTNKIVFKCNFQKIICSMAMPKYTYQEQLESLDCEKCYVFNFTDSSFIYVLNSDNGNPNYTNIKNLGDSISNFRFQGVFRQINIDINNQKGYALLPILPEKFELSGEDDNSLFWKDIFMGEVSIGYKNVPKEKKDFFENCLKTFRKK
ncbi:MAG: hypothetical protein LBO74_00345 [Candidatus Symbiothrix sp.]|jgi:hypothetical protein|nr:hypothetical protein [Candidatus Symbiothrix sp.]